VTHLDFWMPRWQFGEQHEIDVAATPERVYDAIRAVRASDIRFFRTLVAIRRGFRRTPEGILNPSPDKPILDVATSTTFHWLADEAPREVVVGTCVIGKMEKADFRTPPDGVAVAAMNFVVTPTATGSHVTTETRVYATAAKPRRAFAIYWSLIRPGSGIIRRFWLRAIKKRAERMPR